MNNSQQTI